MSSIFRWLCGASARRLGHATSPINDPGFGGTRSTDEVFDTRHDTKFTQLFDIVFEASGIEIVNIPYRTPNANAVAEWWVCPVREECPDRLTIRNVRHLRRVMQTYTTYYNERRPHQSLEQDSPLGLESGSVQGPIRCRQVLGGIIRDYYREGA